MRVRVSLSKTVCHTKQECTDHIREIHQECTGAEELELSEIAGRLGTGYNIRPAICPTGKGESFVSQQLFLVDIDTDLEKGKNLNRIDLPQAIEHSKASGLHPCFGYNTHSSQEGIPKYRIAFVLDQPITTGDQAIGIQTILENAFSGISDPDCKPILTRLFFGTHHGIAYEDYTAVNSAEELKRMIHPSQTKCPVKRKKNASTGIVTATNIDLIRTHNATELREKIGNPDHTEVQSRAELYRFFYSQDLARFLGVPREEKFSCILHSDREPSAEIVHTNKGGSADLYKCWGCAPNCLNIKQVCEKVGNFSSEYQCIEFLKSVFNVSILESVASREFQENCDLILYKLENTGADSFASVCPTADRLTRKTRTRDAVRAIILHAKMRVPADVQKTENGQVIFYASNQEIAKGCERKNLTKMNRVISFLAYLGIVEKISDSEVPKPVLAQVLKHSKQKRHPSFFCIPSFVLPHLEEIETQAIKWIENGYTLAGASYEMFLRTEGFEVAKRLYPQTAYVTDKKGKVKKRKISKKAQDKSMGLTRTILNLIQKNGYVTEAQIIEKIHKKGISKEWIKTRLKRSIPEILLAYDLQKVKCNKGLKQLLNIDGNGYPTIYLKGDYHYEF